MLGLRSPLAGIEKALYSYAVKFYSKANPFNLFATITLPYSCPDHPELADCEVVLDSRLMLHIERSLLGHPQLETSGFVQLASFIETDSSYRFFVTGDMSCSVVSIARSDLMEGVVSYFSGQQRQYSFSDCRSYLQNWSVHTPGLVIDEVLRNLLSLGVLQRYLFADLRSFREDIVPFAAHLDGKQGIMSDLHLRFVPDVELPNIHRLISGADSLGLRAESKPLYYVNRYRRLELESVEGELGNVMDDLHAIAPLFYGTSNYRLRWALIGDFLETELQCRATRSARYLDLLRILFRHQNQLLSRSAADNPAVRAEKKVVSRWYSLASRLVGEMKPEAVGDLLRHRPVVRHRRRPLCINGSFDHVNRLFYVGNIFAGYGRFTSRDQMESRGRSGVCHSRSDTSTFIPVQINVPPLHHKYYAPPILAAGFGFDKRQKQLFDRWFNPEDITIRLSDDTVVYESSISDEELTFHFLGLVLAQFLPVEYALLLAEHADYYDNPFCGPVPPPSESDLRFFRPGLIFRSLCLRRRQWWFRKSLLTPFVRESQLTQATLKFCDYLQSETCCSSNDWYYSVVGAGAPNRGKPRYCNVQEPLSIHALRRTIGSVRGDAWFCFSPMEPPREHMTQGPDRAPILSEVMIEVP